MLVFPRWLLSTRRANRVEKGPGAFGRLCFEGAKPDVEAEWLVNVVGLARQRVRGCQVCARCNVPETLSLNLSTWILLFGGAEFAAPEQWLLLRMGGAKELESTRGEEGRVLRAEMARLLLNGGRNARELIGPQEGRSI